MLPKDDGWLVTVLTKDVILCLGHTADFLVGDDRRRIFPDPTCCIVDVGKRKHIKENRQCGHPTRRDFQTNYTKLDMKISFNMFFFFQFMITFAKLGKILQWCICLFVNTQ